MSTPTRNLSKRLEVVEETEERGTEMGGASVTEPVQGQDVAGQEPETTEQPVREAEPEAPQVEQEPEVDREEPAPANPEKTESKPRLKDRVRNTIKATASKFRRKRSFRDAEPEPEGPSKRVRWSPRNSERREQTVERGDQTVNMGGKKVSDGTTQVNDKVTEIDQPVRRDTSEGSEQTRERSRSTSTRGSQPPIASRSEMSKKQKRKRRSGAERTKPAEARESAEPGERTEPTDGDDGANNAQAPSRIVARRKTKSQPRSTVPVTVHRLTTTRPRTGASSSSSQSDDDGATSGSGSDDELTLPSTTASARQPGVNPADVLSQICRETLTNALSTLDESITAERGRARAPDDDDNRNNNKAAAARRRVAEWAAKRATVRLFATELDSRLFAVSEILDANAVAGARLRRARKVLGTERARLVEVRRARRKVAEEMEEARSSGGKDNVSLFW